MKYKLDLAGKELTVEIRNLAEQANADVLIRLGDTLVLTTSVMSEQEREGIDFFPLTVEYEEKYYAAGKIRGPRYIKRETRPSDEAICNARLIDRTIRPRFPKDLKKEVQVISTVLSWDGENDPDILGVISASLALSISDIPWQGPLGTIRVAKVDNHFVLNPTYEEREKSQIDLVISSAEKKGAASDESRPTGGEILTNMLEGGFDEAQEPLLLEAWEFSEKYLKKLIDFQNEIVAKIGKEKIQIATPKRDLELENEIKEFLGKRLEETIYQKEKMARFNKVSELKKELINFVEIEYPQQGKIKYALDFLEKELERIL